MSRFFSKKLAKPIDIHGSVNYNNGIVKKRRRNNPMNHATLEDCLRLSLIAIDRLRGADLHAMSTEEIVDKLYDAFEEAYGIQLCWLHERQNRDDQRRKRNHKTMFFAVASLILALLALAKTCI